MCIRRLRDTVIQKEGNKEGCEEESRKNIVKFQKDDRSIDVAGAS